ncbi:MAG: hypothetical protein HQK79_18780 [Desulfobacterales bacterium]|nr:hypothetical protein [Desulfobacterales bacterium]MBF0396151.1 hypothetical protein [Desulfobacterales bacterium]
MKDIMVLLVVMSLIFLPIIGNAELKDMSDEQMGTVTGQAGFSNSADFEKVFNAIAGAIQQGAQETAKAKFDEAFALNGDQKGPKKLGFDQAFKKTEDGKMEMSRDVNLNIEMKDVSFDQAFSKVTGVDLGIGNALGINSKMDVKVTGKIRVTTRF